MHILKNYYIIPIFIINLFSFPEKKEIVTSLSHWNTKITPIQMNSYIYQDFAQNSTSPDTNTFVNDSLYIHISSYSAGQDSLPAFNYQNLKNYIFSNLCYPLDAQEKGIEGEVQIHFCVQKNGETTHIRIIKSVHPLLDSTTLQLIQAMPRWKPFTQEFAPDSLSYTIPVTFELKNDR